MKYILSIGLILAMVGVGVADSPTMTDSNGHEFTVGSTLKSKNCDDCKAKIICIGINDGIAEFNRVGDEIFSAMPKRFRFEMDQPSLTNSNWVVDYSITDNKEFDDTKFKVTISVTYNAVSWSEAKRIAGDAARRHRKACKAKAVIEKVGDNDAMFYDGTIDAEGYFTPSGIVIE